MAYRIQTSEEVLAWAAQNHWLLIWATEDYGICAFLSPAGTILEFSFERNKVNLRSLLSYVCK